MASFFGDGISVSGKSDLWNHAYIPLRIANAFGHVVFALTRTGSVTWNVEPAPRADLTVMVPPCNSMMRFAMANPNPVPTFVRVLAPSTCWNSQRYAFGRPRQSLARYRAPTREIADR